MSVKDWRPDPTTDELPDGTIVEAWHDRKMLHRADGPARIESWPDGTRVERWYEHGRLLASVLTRPDGERFVDEAGILDVPLPGGVSMTFVKVPSGTFMMGDADNGPVHQVAITQGFWLAATEITQAQWAAVMQKNPSHFRGDPNLPVEQVSWEDSMVFARALVAPDGLEPDLPTEAEWEYACRADSETLWSFGDDERDLGDYAWFYGNSGNKTHPVGTKRPNAWGLYDMHGNVWEWCRDWHGEYKAAPARDPKGPRSGQYRTLRGGGWRSGVPGYTRSAYRGRAGPTDHDGYVGVRPVLR
jgi:formylglycine-generating enzyme required for sulfatase activity